MTLHDLGYLGQGHYAHGTRANYKQGCKCTPCRSANAAYIAHLRTLHRQGRIPGGHALTSYRVRRCVRSLKAEGFPLYELARRLGLHRETVGRHAALIQTDQPAPKMRASSAARILAFYRRVMAEASESPACTD